MAERVGIVVVAPTLRGQPHTGSNQLGEIMGAIDLAAGIVHMRCQPRHDATASSTSRKRTSPGSPVRQSARLSTRNDLLKPGMTGCSVSLMHASEAAYVFCVAG